MFSMLTQPGYPFVLQQFDSDERLVIEVSNKCHDAKPDLQTIIADNGRDTHIVIDGQVTVILADYLNLDALDVACVVVKSDNDHFVQDIDPVDPSPSVEVIEAMDSIVTVVDFDPITDRIEIASGCNAVFTYANSTHSTQVQIDGDTVFDLIGVHPDQLLSANIVYV